MLFCHLFERVIVTGRDEEAGKNMTTPGLGNANKTCFSMTPSMRNANNMTNKYQKYINIYTVYINIYTTVYIYYIHTYKNDSRGKLKFFGSRSSPDPRRKRHSDKSKGHKNESNRVWWIYNYVGGFVINIFIHIIFNRVCWSDFHWLVVDQPLWKIYKNIENICSSVGMMTFPIYVKK